MNRESIIKRILEHVISKDVRLAKFQRVWVEIELRQASDTSLKIRLLEHENLLDWPKSLIHDAGLVSEYTKLRQENTRLNKNARPGDRIKPTLKLKEDCPSEDCCRKPWYFTHIEGSKFETICGNCSMIIQNNNNSTSMTKIGGNTASSRADFSRWKDFSLFLLKVQGRSMLKASEDEVNLIHKSVGPITYEAVKAFLRVVSARFL